MWYTRDERARDREVLHPQRGVLYKSGVYARNVLCLTLGDLPVVRAVGPGAGQLVPTGREESAEGIVVLWQARLVRHPESRKAGKRIGQTATPRDEGPNGAPRGA